MKSFERGCHGVAIDHRRRSSSLRRRRILGAAPRTLVKLDVATNSPAKPKSICRGFVVSLIAFTLASPALAQTYPPDGPSVPAIANTEDASGAFGQDVRAPAPKGWDQESAWNMKVEGFNDNQGRPIYQPLVVNQDGR
jgi:hypothetical protein